MLQTTTLKIKKTLLPYIIIACSILIIPQLHYSDATRVVRLCIASVDPVKLSSQCVMCNRREFPLTAIGCTGIDRMNELIANPLSVHQALCLINNCRKQVSNVKPEPYYGSVTQAARANYPSASGSRSYEMMSPASMLGGYHPASQSNNRYRGAPYSGSMRDSSSMLSPDTFGMSSPGNSGSHAGASGLPYALVPEPYTPSLFGSRKIKATLVPLFQ